MGLASRCAEAKGNAHQVVQALGHTLVWCYPVPQRGFKSLYDQLRQQHTEDRIRWRLAEIGSQQLIERHPVAFGESFHPH